MVLAAWAGVWVSVSRWLLADLKQVPQHSADWDCVARLGCCGGQMQDTAYKSLDFVEGFVAFYSKEQLARFDCGAVFFEPLD
jgi:hypothetical protein